MTAFLPRLKEAIVYITGQVVTSQHYISSAIRVATLSFAEGLLRMVDSGLAEDLRRLKGESFHRSAHKFEEANARALMAKAIDAANRATLMRRDDQIFHIESDTARTNAERLRNEAVSYALARLIEATEALKAKGGTLAVNASDLAAMLDVPSAAISLGVRVGRFDSGSENAGASAHKALDSRLLDEAAEIAHNMRNDDPITTSVNVAALRSLVLQLWNSATEASKFHQELLGMIETTLLSSDTPTQSQLDTIAQAFADLKTARLTLDDLTLMRSRFLDVGYNPMAGIDFGSEQD